MELPEWKWRRTGRYRSTLRPFSKKIVKKEREEGEKKETEKAWRSDQLTPGNKVLAGDLKRKKKKKNLKNKRRRESSGMSQNTSLTRGDYGCHIRRLPPTTGNPSTDTTATNWEWIVCPRNFLFHCHLMNYNKKKKKEKITILGPNYRGKKIDNSFSFLLCGLLCIDGSLLRSFVDGLNADLSL